MKKIRFFSVVSLFALLLFATPALIAQGRQVPANTRIDMFDDTTRAPQVVRDSEPGVVRNRNMRVRMGMFLPGEGRLDRGAALNLNLFDDFHLLAVLEEVVHHPGDSFTWKGYVDGIEGSSVMMTIDPRGVVNGNINTVESFYTIRFSGNGVHTVSQVDQRELPPDAEPIPVDNAKATKNDFHLSKMGDSGAVIDLLVAYTPAARSAAGGTASMLTLINLAVTETNDSFNNSGVNTQVNLVHTVEVSGNSSGNFSTDLSRLRNKADGYWDNVHSLRDQHCADQVTLINNGSQYCGIAYLMTTVSTSFESSAFAVTARTCATGYYSFGHEIGHNMSARHDWYVDTNTSPYVYNHGFVNVPDRWRTIMAYNSECSANGVSCTRLKYWSNPNVNYQGDPMGVSGSGTGSANNAQALNNTRVTVANFRDSTATNCGSTGSQCSGTEESGTLTGTNDVNYHPNGTYYYSGSSGTHSADLTGPAGADFDLYLWKWNGSSWSTVASSTSATSTESISYSGTAGYYVWRVFSYSGSGSYTICHDRP